MVELHRQAANIQGILDEEELNVGKKLTMKVQGTLSPEALRYYLSDFKSSMLDILDHGRVYVNPLFDPINGLNYKKFEKMQESLAEIITKSLPEDRRHLLIDYEDTLLDLYAIQTENTYKQGLREGFKLALELLSLKVDLAVDHEKRAIGG